MGGSSTARKVGPIRSALQLMHICDLSVRFDPNQEILVYSSAPLGEKYEIVFSIETSETVEMSYRVYSI